MHPSIHARRTPDKPAYIMTGSGEVVTYRQLDDRSNQVARHLRALGLKAGDTIALFMDNSPRYLEIVWGAHRAGLIYTAIPFRSTAEEAAYILNDSGARLAVVSASKALLGDDLKQLAPNVALWAAVDGAIDGMSSWEAGTRSMPARRIEDEKAGGDMLYSSGTTGRPKGIRNEPVGDDIETPPVLLHSTQKIYGFDEGTVYLSTAPLYHAGPLRVAMVIHRLGGTVIFMEHFDAEQALAAIDRHRVTHSQWVPTMFVRLLKLPPEVRARYDVSSLRVAIHGAAPCAVPVKEQMIDWWGPVLYEYYTGTECNGYTSCDSAEWLARKGTVGRATLGELRILGENGDVLPAGEPGTIYFADGPSFEYHNDPVKTAESRSAEGWTTLGDIGYVDGEGWLFLTDRKAHTLISGGVNLYPQETENVLITHPKVADVAVIGVPHDDLGEEMKAVVQLVDPAEAGPVLARELIAFCRERLSPLKCPKSVDFEPNLPRQPTGKLYKRLIRDRYWQGRSSRII
ncbi:AMP-binding protein [Reyranella sp.]|uniref:AMP-binding protein n=1 Tax=Reyranella sp. TaxID=1929291 RepID=UPI003D1063C8